MTNTKGSSLAGSAAAMATGTLVSRTLGLVRGAMLAASIATVGGAANAFAVANKLPTIIYMLIAGGVLNAVLVPQIVRAMRQKDGGTRYVNQLLTLGSLMLAGVTVILTAGASVLLTLYAANMSAEWQPVALAFAYICLPQLFFYGVYTLLGQVLNAKGNFGPYMWAPALNNVVSIIGLAVYLWMFGEYRVDALTAADWDTTRIWLVAGTATAGIAAQALVLIIPLYRSGFRYRPIFSIRGSGLGRTSRVASWAFAALAVGQLGYLAISNLAVAADTAGEELGITVASNAAYDHAFTIFMLPQSLITVSLVTAMFTRLSHHAAVGDVRAVRANLSMGLRTLAVFTVFASAAIMVLAIPIVSVILAGRPTWEAQQAIGHVVVAFAIGLVPIGAWTMVQRVYYAFEDTRTLFRIQMPMMVIVVISCVLAFFVLPANWWVVGAAIGTTISNSVGALVAYLALRQRLPSLDGARVLRTHLRLFIAVTPVALLGWGALHLWGVKAGLFGSLTRVLVLGGAMGVAYLVVVRLLQVTELGALFSRAASLLAPLTRRINPVLDKIPGGAGMRKIGAFFTGASSSKKAGVVSEHVQTWQAGQLISQRYRLLMIEEMTDDGARTVWTARDEILSKQVHVEELHTDPELRAIVLDAARRQTLLTDEVFPRISRVADVDDRGLIVSDLVEGSSMESLILNGAITPGEARSIVGEAALGLERARRQGMSHLALGPCSIIVTRAGEVRVLGLGYASSLAGIASGSSDDNAHQDTMALAQVLFAGLSGHWVGSPDRTAGLTAASQSVTDPQRLHELAPAAPLDLIRLCHLVMSPEDDGPRTPGSLAESLRPWNPVTSAPEAVTVVTEDFQTGEFTSVPAPLAAPEQTTVTEPTTTEEEEPAPMPRGDQDSSQIPPTAPTSAVNRGNPSRIDMPGAWDLPQDAGPAEVEVGHPSRARAGVPAGGSSTLGPAPVRDFPQVEPEPSMPLPVAPSITGAGVAGGPDRPRGVEAAGSGPGLWDRAGDFTGAVSSHFRPVQDAEEPRKRKFNPAGFVLLALITIIVFATVLATSSLRGARDFDPESLPPPGQVTDTPTETLPTEVGTESPSPTETEDPTPTAATIEVVDAISFDPTVSGGENQDLAYRAIDGDPTTIWRSMRYNVPTYAIKSGLGFTLELKETSKVSEVILDVNGTGGKVEIRASRADSPDTGKVLASGTMDGETTFKFDTPVETKSIALWFPELPVAESDGNFRIELAEIDIR